MKAKFSVRYFLLCPALFNGLFWLTLVISSTVRSQTYDQDFISCYLLAKAILQGVNPYQPLPELAARFQLDPAAMNYPHPTPHTVMHGLLVAPVSWLPYRAALVAWQLFSLGCLAAATAWLLRWWGGKPASPAVVLLAACIAVGWWPVTLELFSGQVNLPLLVLLLCAWHTLQQGRDVTAGALLGLTIAVKMMAWPIVLFLLIRRRWRAVAAAGATAGTAAGLSLLLAGWNGMKDYLKIGPAVAEMYNGYYANLSLWSLGTRLFVGLGLSDKLLPRVVAEPLWYAPQLARWVSAAAVLTVLLGGLLLAARARRLDTQFGLLTCVSILVNPVAWQCYLVLTLIPLVIVCRRLSECGFPRRATINAVAALALLSIPAWTIKLVLPQFVVRQGADGGEIFSFWVTGLTFLPALALLRLAWLVWRSDHFSPVSAALRADRPQPALAARLAETTN